MTLSGLSGLNSCWHTRLSHSLSWGNLVQRLPGHGQALASTICLCPEGFHALQARCVHHSQSIFLVFPPKEHLNASNAQLSRLGDKRSVLGLPVPQIWGYVCAQKKKSPNTVISIGTGSHCCLLKETWKEILSVAVSFNSCGTVRAVILSAVQAETSLYWCW